MRVVISGISGHMGELVRESVEKDYSMTLAGGICIDAETYKAEGCPVFKTPEECDVCADMLIDFSNHILTISLLEFCKKNNMPVVLCTTGHTDEEKAAVRSASEYIPVFYSANMSVGIAVLINIAKEAVKAFPDADIEIVEVHHNRKLDVPSGTALSIANELRTVREDASLCVGRHENGKRNPNEIGIHSIRAGNEVGTHEVIIATDSQILTLKHEARNRALFADGAIAAAKYLYGKAPGIYTMKDMLN